MKVRTNLFNVEKVEQNFNSYFQRMNIDKYVSKKKAFFGIVFHSSYHPHKDYVIDDVSHVPKETIKSMFVHAKILKASL